MTVTQCPRHVSSATLSAWRDAQLASAASADMAEHIAHCAACQAILAEFEAIAQTLRRHESPARLLSRLQAHTWTSMPPTLPNKQGVTPMPTTGRARWGVMSGAIAALLIIALFVTVLHFGAAGKRKTVSGAPPSVLHIVQSIPLEQFGLTAFVVTDVAPDGSFVLGLATKGHQSVVIGAINLKTKNYQQLAYVSEGWGGDVTPVTDGRYVAYQDYDYQNHWQGIAVLDMTTLHQTTIARQDGTSAHVLALHNGIMYWQTLTEVILSQHGRTGTSVNLPGALLATDVATGTTHTFLASLDLVSSVIWPLALYQPIDTHGQKAGALHVFNLSAGQDNAVPAVTDNFAVTQNNGVLYADSFDSGAALTVESKAPSDAAWQSIATIPLGADRSLKIMETNTGIQYCVANDRLIFYEGDSLELDPYSADVYLLAWDRATKTAVNLGQQPLSTYTAVPITIFARGQWFMYQTLVNDHNVLHIINTDQLPKA